MPWSDYEETTYMNKEKNGFRTAAVKLGLSPNDLSQRNGVANAVLAGVEVAAVFYGLCHFARPVVGNGFRGFHGLPL